jgi:Protein of unknown function (DUF3810)
VRARPFMVRGALSVLALATALIAAVTDLPAAGMRAYAARVYPAWQAVATPLSNRLPIPLFDATLALVIVLAVVGLGTSTRRAVRRRSVVPLLRFVGTVTVVAALIYLWFLAAWGYNYRRAGVETLVPEFVPERATPVLVRRLAELAVQRVNELHAPAHADGFPALDAVPADLVRSLHDTERRLGRTRSTVPSIPKRPWTAPYMRAVGVSGMLAPLFLETYLNPDLTGPERPYVLAHEWAHLSGFAPEEDASFVGLITALGAGPPARYSAWLVLMSDAAVRLPSAERRQVLAPLESGPRADLAAINERLRLRVAWLDRASWVAYDRAIKSQGAESGVAGYGRVIDLVLGSGVLETEGLQP